MKLKTIILLHLICTLCSANNKPNIIFILVDDMGWSDIGCYGGEVKTPNLDKLADNGLRLTQMHNTSKCFPSRACLRTGVYAQQCGMNKGFKKITNAVTLGEVLKKAGYRTLASGKHHSNESLYDRGFDRYFGLRDGACNFFNPGLQRAGEAQPAQKKYGKRVWVDDKKVMTPFTPQNKDFYTTDAFTDKAIEYLDEYKDEEKPFFLYLSYNAPHDPLQAWPEDIKKYKETYKVGYEAIREQRIKKMKSLGLIAKDATLAPAEHQAWSSLNPAQQETEALKMAIYAAMIDRVDQNIGRLLTKLEALGKRENTLIMFASDNGSSAENAEKAVKNNSGKLGSMAYWASLGSNWANISNTPYRKAKNDSHEGGICTPFIANWPGVIASQKRSTYSSHFIDIMSTLVDITGAEYPSEHMNMKVTPMQGVSLLPLFKGEVQPKRAKPLFWQWKKGRAVRLGDWKLISMDHKTWQLYDMASDAFESKNLASQYPEKVAYLKQAYQNWSESNQISKRKK
jgi:arylsulfatase A-like enzyme